MLLKTKTLTLCSLFVVAITSLSACSGLDKWRRFQYDLFGGYDEESKPVLEAMMPILDGIEFTKLNELFDKRLMKSDQSLDLISNRYLLRSPDCNISFEFTVEDKLNMITQITGDYGGVCKNESQKDALIKNTMYEYYTRPHVGSCSTEIATVKEFQAKGGQKLSLEEIKAWREEVIASQAYQSETNTISSATKSLSQEISQAAANSPELQQLNQKLKEITQSPIGKKVKVNDKNALFVGFENNKAVVLFEGEQQVTLVDPNDVMTAD